METAVLLGACAVFGLMFVGATAGAASASAPLMQSAIAATAKSEPEMAVDFKSYWSRMPPAPAPAPPPPPGP